MQLPGEVKEQISPPQFHDHHFFSSQDTHLLTSVADVSVDLNDIANVQRFSKDKV